MSFTNLRPQTPIYPAEAADYAATALALSEQAARSCRAEFDIAYGGDPHQRLDIYLPEPSSEAPAPVLIFAHGGAWTHGYKEWIGLMAPPLVARGVMLVSVSYRLAPAVKFPVPLEDCLMALAWTHANIARYDGDPARIAVGGHSAGGHLYALAALRADLHARFGLPRHPVTACFPLSAQMDMRFPERPPGSAEERIYELFLPDADAAPAASPVVHLGAGTPFFLLAYGSEDFPRIVRGNERMAAALAAAGLPHEVLVLQGYDHFRTALDARDPANPWIVRVLEIMARSPARAQARIAEARQGRAG
jgi:acetyl esterase/lipase